MPDTFAGVDILGHEDPVPGRPNTAGKKILIELLRRMDSRAPAS